MHHHMTLMCSYDSAFTCYFLPHFVLASSPEPLSDHLSSIFLRLCSSFSGCHLICLGRSATPCLYYLSVSYAQRWLVAYLSPFIHLDFVTFLFWFPGNVAHPNCRPPVRAHSTLPIFWPPHALLVLPVRFFSFWDHLFINLRYLYPMLCSRGLLVLRLEALPVPFDPRIDLVYEHVSFASYSTNCRKTDSLCPWKLHRPATSWTQVLHQLLR